jgi:hypothetical protein
MAAMLRAVAALLLLTTALATAGAHAQPADTHAPPAGSALASAGAPRTVGLIPLHIHVRGAAELHAVATADHGDLTLHGELIDDAGTPIAGAPIALQAPSAADPRTTIRVGPLRPCEEAAGRPVPRSGPDDLVVETDDRGGFCAIGRTSALAGAIKLRFRGSHLYDAAELSVPVEAAQEHLLRTLLRFEPPPETLDLDRESVTVTASLRIDRSNAARAAAAGSSDPSEPTMGALPPNPQAEGIAMGALPPNPRAEGSHLQTAGSAQRASLPLVLTDERGAHVADAVTGGDGRARFEVKTAALAGPGSGALMVRFAGNAVLAKADGSQPVVRRAETHLALARPVDRADAEEGVTLDVDVTTTRGPVSGGVVEVRRALSSVAGPGGESVGAGTVDEHGRAHIIAAFSAGGATQTALALRYVPAAPWYRPGAELRVDVKLAAPGIGRQLALGAVVLAAAAWVVGGWRRSPRPPVAPGVDGVKAPPSGHPGVHVLASPADLVGWRGTVADAHDGSPVAGARLAIVAPAFVGDGVVARAVADQRGAFTLEATYQSDARLIVQSAEHSTHEQALPPPSVLGVALITRRRAMLERLVRWARQKGAPFDGAPEPTPGHVRRVASRASALDVEAWASRIEQAAYGCERVDDALERDVRSAEPRPLR